MRIAKIKLSNSCPFFFIPEIDIMLTQENPLSNEIDMDDLPYRFKKIIDDTIRLTDDISIVKLNNTASKIIDGSDYIDLGDEPKQEDKSSKSTGEQDIKNNIITYTTKEMNAAKAFLLRNGNVVRAAICKLKPNKKIVGFLSACIEIESLSEKRRDNIISDLNKVLAESLSKKTRSNKNEK